MFQMVLCDSHRPHPLYPGMSVSQGTCQEVERLGHRTWVTFPYILPCCLQGNVQIHTPAHENVCLSSSAPCIANAAISADCLL